MYVGSIPSLRQLLLNSKLYFSLVTLAETFLRTDFRLSDGSRKMKEHRDTTDRDVINHGRYENSENSDKNLEI